MKLIKFMLLAVICMSCQHNGNIGFLYGTWRVESYECDGTPVEDPGHTTFFGFQGGIVCATIVSDAYGDHSRNYGTWSDDGDTFTLDFTHSDSSTPPGGDGYTPPAWLGMTSLYPMEMSVTGRDTDNMTWRWVSDDGKIHIYKLHKTW